MSMQQEIEQALRIIHENGATFEVRAPGAYERKNRTDSGFFRDPTRAATAIINAGLDGHAPGIYVTLNPVNPALWARASDRIKTYADKTTSDIDVVKREWLLVDIDPERPSDVSATDAEHVAALERAVSIRATLQQQYTWPAPLYGDSGNGAYLLYRINLPNDADATKLVRRVLAALDALFSDEHVHIDTTTYNAARIAKIFGTLACKGDNVPERPHRRSCLIDIPSDIVPVTREQLQALADSVLGPEQNQAAEPRSTSNAYDVSEFISRHQLLALDPKSWQGSNTIWVLEECPFNSDHRRTARIIKHASGAISAGCFYNSCSHWGWRELRAKYEPGGASEWQEIAPSFNGKIDLSSGVAAPVQGVRFDDDDNANSHYQNYQNPQNSTTSTNFGNQDLNRTDPLSRDSSSTSSTFSTKDASFEWGELLPIETGQLAEFPTHVYPKPINDFVEKLSIAMQVPHDMAGCMVLAVLATICQKKYEVEIKTGWRVPVNLYILSIGESGSGKSPTLRAIFKAIYEFEQRERERIRPLQKEAQTAYDILEGQLTQMKQKAIKAEDESTRRVLQEQAQALARELDATHVPVLPRLITDDITMEKLAMMMAEQRGMLANISAEGTLFSIMAGRYTPGHMSLEAILNAWSGDPIIVDRGGRSGELIKKPALTLGLMVQPGVLRSLRDKPEFRERGLLARFLYSVPEDWVGRRAIEPPSVPESVNAVFEHLLTTLLEQKPWTDPEGEVIAQTLTLDSQAYAALMSFKAWLEPRLAPTEELGLLRDWGSKLVDHTARIAGLLHLATQATRYIGSVWHDGTGLTCARC
jgi:hypothetical protein